MEDKEYSLLSLDNRQAFSVLLFPNLNSLSENGFRYRAGGLSIIIYNYDHSRAFYLVPRCTS